MKISTPVILLVVIMLMLACLLCRQPQPSQVIVISATPPAPTESTATTMPPTPNATPVQQMKTPVTETLRCPDGAGFTTYAITSTYLITEKACSDFLDFHMHVTFQNMTYVSMQYWSQLNGKPMYSHPISSNDTWKSWNRIREFTCFGSWQITPLDAFTNGPGALDKHAQPWIETMTCKNADASIVIEASLEHE